jgi:hypothetical protein
MNTAKPHRDPLGRSNSLTVRILLTLATLLATTGSAWPIQARSIRAIFDTRRHA